MCVSVNQKSESLEVCSLSSCLELVNKPLNNSKFQVFSSFSTPEFVCLDLKTSYSYGKRFVPPDGQPGSSRRHYIRLSNGYFLSLICVKIFGAAALAIKSDFSNFCQAATRPSITSFNNFCPLLWYQVEIDCQMACFRCQALSISIITIN